MRGVGWVIHSSLSVVLAKARTHCHKIKLWRTRVATHLRNKCSRDNGSWLSPGRHPDVWEVCAAYLQSLLLQRLQKPHRLTLRGRHELALPHHAAAADEGADGPAGDADAVIGGPAGLGRDPFVGDGLAALEIDDCEVGVIAGGDAALAGHVVEARRAG